MSSYLFIVRSIIHRSMWLHLINVVGVNVLSVCLLSCATHQVLLYSLSWFLAYVNCNFLNVSDQIRRFVSCHAVIWLGSLDDSLFKAMKFHSAFFSITVFLCWKKPPACFVLQQTWFVRLQLKGKWSVTCFEEMENNLRNFELQDGEELKAMGIHEDGITIE